MMVTKTTIVSIVLALALVLAAPASAQTYQVLYNFTGQSDGGNPEAGITLDHGGNLYGTTYEGGSSNCSSYGHVGCGTAFKLSRHTGGWTFAALHQFVGIDGANPEARVIFGPNGALFGTTNQGGGLGYGTVFELQPPANICPTPSCLWLLTQLTSFVSIYGPAYPGPGDLIFDAQGNIYGTSGGGGYLCDDGPCGTVYELSPSQQGWTVRYWEFGGGVNCCPVAGLLQYSPGVYYGTNSSLPGGLYEFTGDSLDVFYTFTEQSAALGGLTEDSAGLLYGTTSQGGTGGGGTFFSYLPGSPNITTLYNFNGPNQWGAGPTATLLMDAAGNFYGTTQIDGANQQGSVFKLSQSNGVWALTTLHDFTGGADGGQPFGQLSMDANGNIYGTAQYGGSSVGDCYQGLGCGVIFEITAN